MRRLVYSLTIRVHGRGATANLVKTEYDSQNQKDDHHPGPDCDAFEEIHF